MITNGSYFPGKKFSLVPATASRTFIVAQIKYFIHASMKSGGFKCVTNFINHVKNYFVYFRMKWTITFAIKTVCIGPYIFFWHFYMRRFVKLRIYFQQFARLVSPRLVTKQVDLWNDANIILLACSDYFLYFCF